MTRLPRAFWVAALCGLAACRDTVNYNEGEIDFEPRRPTFDDPSEVPPYTGDDPIVLEAQTRFPTGLELHRKVIWRTCTPNGGVCHNSKEYPDLRTPATFASAFSAPCNVQPGEPSSVFDGCETPGDRLRLGGDGPAIEIAWLERIVGQDEDYGDGSVPEDAPGLHVHLTQPVDPDRGNRYTTGHFIRSFVDDDQVRDIAYASFTTRWHLLGDGTHLFGRVQEYQNQDLQELMSVGIAEADANRNGVLGATLGLDVQMLAPGSPERSYLIGRIRGEMFDAPLPGSRMPLANPPLTIPEMLALYCLVEGYPAEGGDPTLTVPIDYASCSYTEDPEALNLLGNGVTWAARVQPILEANCGGCHSAEAAEGGLALVGEGVYERLLMPSAQVPDLPLVAPMDPEGSYLYLKLLGDDAIVGNPMPYNPLTGAGSLTEAELGDILTWITNGAVEDQ